ncbi:transcriptional Coactivator p15-domain-containing protein [Trametes polyzona]|nr:transcriptional Coactivator p15-domain-containing protein [Trametes polyzona]
MAKRKVAAASSDDDDDYDAQDAGAASSSPDRPIQTARKSGKKAKTKASTNDEESEGEVRKPAKKSKAAAKPSSIKKPDFGSSPKGAQDDDDVQAGVNESGEKFVELGKKKRATVRQFKGSTFLDIREFYGDDNDLKPGKKGISLAREQWEALKKSSDMIDAFFAKLAK